MADLSASLLLVKPVSTLKKPIEINPKSAFINTCKAIGKGFMLDSAGASESLLDIVADAGLKDKPGEVGWVLIYQSLMLAVAELVTDSDDLFAKPKPTAAQQGELGKQLEAALSTGHFKLDGEFFKHPQHFALLEVFKPELKTWLIERSLDEAQATMICHRLADKFTLALHNQWLEKPDDYVVIKNAVATPFTEATLPQRRWLQYNAWLNAQVNERMFHEAFSLKQVYVSPRAYYQEKSNKAGDDEEHMGHARHNETKQIVVELHKELIEWAQHFDANDAFRVISGGPGSGKSSLSKMLAAELAAQCGFPVLFIPLHLFDPTADLAKGVEDFVRNNRYLSGSPLDAKQGESRLLIIFDGLDELSEQGKNATEIALSFVDIVIRDITNHNLHKHQRQVLITGRDLAVQSALKRFRGSHQVYQLLPYYVVDDEQEGMVDSSQLLKTDLRDVWWQLYGKANGKGYKAMPLPLKAKQLEEITSQPLLNYLVALSFERDKLNFDEQTTLNRVYQDLLLAVYERQYDESGIHKATGNLGERQFFHILEEIALAIWHGDGRTTTIAYIEKRCQTSRLTEALASFEGSAQSGVTRLLTAFYFRQCEELQQGDKTFEFTHKSFGEYLTARRLVRMLERVCNKLEKWDEDPEEEWNERDALTYWAELCGPATMDRYLFRFVQDELALKSPEQWAKWQEYLCRLIESALKYGMPMEKLELKTFAQMREHSRNAEECLLVMLFSCAQQSKVVSQIKWPSQTAFGDWVKQLQGQRGGAGAGDKLALSCLGYLDLSGCVLYFQDFYGANLLYSVLNGVSLVGAMLGGADLRHTNLRNADLSSADLRHADLRNADLSSADLRNADLSSADLRNANLRNANLRNANLSRADLRNFDLSSADLRHADLSSANLSRADLRNADLRHADLRNADLSDAKYQEEQLSDGQLKQIRAR
jgi:uncharacterized protein YjbI with pentapeptide repeats